MPYDSVYSSARRARCVPPGANFIVTPLRWSACTAARGWLYCVFLAAGLRLTASTSNFSVINYCRRHGRAMAKFLSSWGLTTSGRDVLSRLLSGAAPTVGGAFVVTLAATICGLVLGTFAGATHGLRSAVLNHILDTLLAIPSLLLAIIVVAFAGPSLSHAMFAVWLALLPRMVRSIYSMVHDELEKEYVIAARLDGASTLNILWFAVMPNITAGLVTEITRALSMAILDIAALGFLDLGAQLPSPEWGAMLGDALELIYVAPWTVMLPGAAIMISVLLVNLLGDGVRRAIIAGVE